MSATQTGARFGWHIGRLKARSSGRAVRYGFKVAAALALVAAVAVAVLTGSRMSAVCTAKAEPGSTQLLVASMLVPSLLSTDLHLQDNSGADVTATVGELLVASYIAESLKVSPCGPPPSLDERGGVGAALAEITANLPSAVNETVAAAMAEWRGSDAGSRYQRILADLPAELAGSGECRVLRDIAADRLSQAVRQWEELKPRLGGAGL
ncbi:MAG TPA: hypothetical protein VHG92_14385 [Afifellaceae bacterium]|nr:hypothetical protein [Afifellaceae bacterium]